MQWKPQGTAPVLFRKSRQKIIEGRWSMKMLKSLTSSADNISDCAAYIPCYNNGNVVQAVTKDGQTVMVEKSIKSLLKNLLRRNGQDYSLLKKSISGCTGKDKCIPVPLSIDTVLIPAKVRKAIGTNDGAFAYVDLYSIESLYGDKNSTIRLRCGRDINTLESEKTIRSRMKAGAAIMEWFSSRLLGDGSLKDCISGIKGEYDKAATKGDITLLAYEIMKLRNLIGK
jgi:hypothetical protein